jgi:Metal-dependent amidase/aminoacylase/carboxypeptidase
VLVGAQIINQIQSIVARNVDPLQAAVVSICMFQAGNTDNVIPQTARLRGTARSLAPDVRDLLEKRLHEVVEGTPPARRDRAARLSPRLSGAGEPRGPGRVRGSVAGEIVGNEKVNTAMAPVMGAEDFSYMLQARPGAFIFVGNGNTAGCITRPTISTTR